MRNFISVEGRLNIGVDVLGLPHAIMITTADVTDRNGAIDMVDYYCDVTNHLSLIRKLLVDAGTQERILLGLV